MHAQWNRHMKQHVAVHGLHAKAWLRAHLQVRLDQGGACVGALCRYDIVSDMSCNAMVSTTS